MYEVAALDEVLEPHLGRGVAVALLLATIDSSSFEIPDDLPEDELTIVVELGLDASRF